MGEVERDDTRNLLLVRSEIILYGRAADEILAGRLADGIMSMWNDPEGQVNWNGQIYQVRFLVTGRFQPEISADEIHANLDPSLNFLRVEQFARGNISFMDESGSNTGYFKLDNLVEGSTTAEHEYGHGLGLSHPQVLDIRGKGRPGIMYPRGTWVDPEFQWDPGAVPGAPGGTMNPSSRRVLASDIASLNLQNLVFDSRGRAILGDFTNLYHDPH